MGANMIILAKCDQITDNGLMYLKGVRIVNLSYCRNITDKGLCHLKGIYDINLVRCPNISNIGLAYLCGVSSITCSYCEEDVTNYRFGITKVGINLLKNANTNLKIYNTNS